MCGENGRDRMKHSWSVCDSRDDFVYSFSHRECRLFQITQFLYQIVKDEYDCSWCMNLHFQVVRNACEFQSIRHVLISRIRYSIAAPFQFQFLQWRLWRMGCSITFFSRVASSLFIVPLFTVLECIQSTSGERWIDIHAALPRNCLYSPIQRSPSEEHRFSFVFITTVRTLIWSLEIPSLCLWSVILEATAFSLIPISESWCWCESTPFPMSWWLMRSRPVQCIPVSFLLSPQS